ncbi:HD domain-containing protein [Treponema ruminis]|uniref:Putative hydrolase of HD superfamily n=1 Tax=Treponema ruminis TaxID=744515 RepID=A0A7W8G996_9SPIR|nr:HD domain-containing protein [Treponema ruminis]MBB5226208.1 putative hydrolase of HD superfamily [Treponema ruminis]QSI02884.1 HD domain-containing protein [Treponema ruminis]
MLDKKFILKIFEGFSIQRWNDLVRPFDLVEMDKAAEKMVAAYIIAKYEESQGHRIDWEWMIYASLFDLLKKIALCDIKSPVQQMIREKYPSEYKKLNEWVFSKFQGMISDQDLLARFSAYLDSEADLDKKEFTLTERVFEAAHKFSSLRELEMIAPVNEKERIDPIHWQLRNNLQEYTDLKGVKMLVNREQPFQLIMKIEQLRFQTRWNRTPRVPRTNVLGHCFFVAVITLLLLRDSQDKPCPKRLFNDFFCGLFHDLPESVTRDIISPVKQATNELPGIVKQIEDELVRSELVPLMDSFYVDEILYFTNDEFQNRILVTELDGQQSSQVVSYEELCDNYNSDVHSPVDGKLVRLADHLSAFLEAESSIKFGITSKQLTGGRDNILKSYSSSMKINGIDAMQLFWSLMED